MIRAVLAASLVCVMVAGCSVAGILAGSTSFEPPKEPTCHGVGRPIADTVIAVPTASFATAFALDDCKTEDEDLGKLCLYYGSIGLGIAALFAASATLGYIRSSRCTDAKNAYRDWRKDHPGRQSPAMNAPPLGQ